MQTWDQVRLGLLARGYRLVQFWQLSCAVHGDYRLGIEAEAELHHCPVCERPCEAVFLACGYTRRELPFVEQIAKPLALRWRKVLVAKEQTVQYGREYVLHSPRV